MKKEGYIPTVLSRITDETRKAEVLAEMSDHLQNKTAYFIDIGYEQEPAAEKAERALGDLEQARVVGEQLGIIKKNKRLPRALLNVAAIALFLLSVYIFIMSAETVDFFYWLFFAQVDCEPVNFADFLLKTFCWCAWLGLLLLCMRYRVLAGSILNIPSGVMLSGVVMVYVMAVLKAILAGKNAGALFYFENFGGYYARESQFVFAGVIFAGIAATAALTAAVLVFKKKRLTYYRADYRLQQIIRTGVLCLLIGSSIFTAAVSISALTQKRVVRERAAHTLALMDDFVLEHIDGILAKDKTAARVALQELLGTENVAANLRCKADGICFYTYTENGNTYFRLYCELQDIELMEANDLEKAKLCDKANPQNLPKPYALAISGNSYSSSEKGALLDVFYNDTYEDANKFEDSISDKVIYRRMAGGAWDYVNSVFCISGKLYDYTAAHEEMLRSALEEKLCDAHYYEEYIDCNYVLHQKVFAISYDDVLDQYQADLQVETDYWTFIDGKLFALTPELYNIISVSYKVENGKAVILELWRPEDGDMYVLSIKARFCKEGFEQWEKHWEENTLDEFNYSGMARRIKKRCKQQVYGYIYSIEENGSCEYSVLTASGFPTNEIIIIHLEKRK